MDASEIAELGRQLIESPAEAIIYADRDGVIRLWNPGAERIFGFSASEAVGESLDIIIPPKLRERHWEGYNRVMAGGESHYAPGDMLSVPGQTKSGERVSLEFTVVPHQKNGSMVGIMAVLRNVTSHWQEMKQLKQQLEQLREQTGGE